MLEGESVWNERYSQPGYAYGTEPNQFLVSVSGRIPRSRVLSLTEGEGRNGVYLAGLGCEVTGVDGSEVGLEKAKKLAAEQGVKISTVVADLKDFSIEPESWDGIISIFSQLPSAIRIPLHRAIVRGLKPGGVFVLEAFTRQQLKYGTGGPKDVDMLYSLEGLRQELAGLQFSHAIETKRKVLEGRCHTGLASVVQIVGVKPAA